MTPWAGLDHWLGVESHIGELGVLDVADLLAWHLLAENAIPLGR